MYQSKGEEFSLMFSLTMRDLEINFMKFLFCHFFCCKVEIHFL